MTDHAEADRGQARTSGMPFYCPGAAEPAACLRCAVRHNALCDGLDDQGIGELTRIMAHRQFAAGETVMLEGEPSAHAYIVIRGALKLYKSLPDGRAQITGIVLPGGFVGIAAERRHDCSAEAIAAAELCCLPRAALDAVFARHPDLGRRLLTIGTDEIAASREHMLLLGRKTAIERVASFLSNLAHGAERAGCRATKLQLPMRRADLADYLGLTIETVSRAFGRLGRLGLIRIPRRDQVEIVAAGRLAAVAQGTDRPRADQEARR